MGIDGMEFILKLLASYRFLCSSSSPKSLLVHTFFSVLIGVVVSGSWGDHCFLRFVEARLTRKIHWHFVLLFSERGSCVVSRRWIVVSVLVEIASCLPKRHLCESYIIDEQERG